MAKSEKRKFLKIYKSISKISVHNDGTKDVVSWVSCGCPEEKYRVLGHVNCFNCHDCWIYALENSLNAK